jgi:hypothetical protein
LVRLNKYNDFFFLGATNPLNPSSSQAAIRGSYELLLFNLKIEKDRKILGLELISGVNSVALIKVIVFTFEQ